MRKNLDYDVFFLNVFSYFLGDFERVPASTGRLFSIFFFFERDNGMISEKNIDRTHRFFEISLITLPLLNHPRGSLDFVNFFFENRDDFLGLEFSMFF